MSNLFFITSATPLQVDKASFAQDVTIGDGTILNGKKVYKNLAVKKFRTNQLHHRICICFC
jgi:hypothetical protein